MQIRRGSAVAFSLLSLGALGAFALACESNTEGSSGTIGFDSGTAVFEAGSSETGPIAEAGTDTGATDAGADAADAGKILPSGVADPIPYLSRADSPFNGVSFPSYFHFEDWEDGLVNTPGVTASSMEVSGSFPTLIDSIDGDDGVVDGKCEKAVGTCNSGFSGSGVFEITFDAAVLGALPTHAGIAWTDGSPSCDAVFEAYDAANVMIGTKTAAAVGDGNNSGGVAEDRFFSVVHGAGVKKIVVRSSAGGVEVDHLQYGR